MVHDVFISYSSREKHVADAVCATLESKQIRCSIAPRDVLRGEPWRSSIVEVFGAGQVFVLVFSNGSNRSDDVLREVGLAVDHAVPVIPFRIEEVEPSSKMRYYISRIHWLDALAPSLERHLRIQADRLQAFLCVGPSRRSA
jgi:hypothetical protein